MQIIVAARYIRSRDSGRSEDSEIVRTCLRFKDYGTMFAMVPYICVRYSDIQNEGEAVPVSLAARFA